MRMSTIPAPALPALLARLPELMLRDQQRLGRRLEGARRIRKPEARAAVLAEIAAEIEQGRAADRQRARAAVPAVTLPGSSCRSARRRTTILAAIRDHQVVIVAGETGSGQDHADPQDLPGAGPRRPRHDRAHPAPPDRGPHGRRARRRGAGHAARRGGRLEGPLHRPGEPGRTFVKLMTDGILLAEIQTDRELRAYDTIIIDEAHERSLNIDFLLGYLAQLLPRRPDLKVVITSATIDPERFSRHFGDAPIVEVSGPYVSGGGALPAAPRRRTARTRRPRPDHRDLRRRRRAPGRGPGRHPGLPLRRAGDPRHRGRAGQEERCSSTEVLPLYARLSHAEQHRVFQRHTGRRIVLATNVAETSLTVPGIKYVIDPGTARISRYSHRTKVQRLPIEPISPGQRQPAQGPLRPYIDGICIRLYSEDDFLDPPGVHRRGDPPHQPRLRHPADDRGRPRRHREVPLHRPAGPPQHHATACSSCRSSARSTRRRRTRASGSPDLGRKLSQLPVDPRLARMVAGGRPQRLRPRGHGDRGRAVHPGPARAPRREAGAGGPAARPLQGRDQPTSSPSSTCGGTSASSRRSAPPPPSAGCARQEYLNFLRIREWQDIYSQLRTVAKQMGIQLVRARTTRAGPARPHLAARRAAVAHRHEGREDHGRRRQGPGRTSTWAPAAPSSRSSPARRCSRSRRAWSCRPSWWRPPGCGRGSTPRSSRSGSSRSPSTWSSARTASRTGRRTRRR